MDARGRIKDSGAAGRLWKRDAALFSDDPEVQALVSGRLGWIGLSKQAADAAGALAELADAVRAEGIEDIVLLGMGGSSLAPLVLARVIGPADGSPRLHVLDTTSPWSYMRLTEQLTPATTLVIVASKSGTTIEPMSLYSVFRTWLDGVLHEQAGERFIAITDPGSPLEDLAKEQGFAAVFHAPADVGGRYSALTAFGMVPAALMGMDVTALARSAAQMEQTCAAEWNGNPAAALAAWIEDARADGRDKLTMVCSEALAPFALWVEQLVAESTGKQGLGVVPVVEKGLPDAAALGSDRAVFVLRSPGDTDLADLAGKLPDGTPLFEVILEDAHDLGGEFVRWEMATALVGYLMGVNPFDEPNVSEAKQATSAILDKTLIAPPAQLSVGETTITADLPTAPATGIGSMPAALEALLDGAGPGSYLAVLAYMPEDAEIVDPLRDALASVSRARSLACCFEIGPRYLHSTGQLHKGGPATGRFLIITARDSIGPAVPGQRFTLAQLHRAQAEGDFVTLAKHGLPVVRIDLAEPAHGPVRLVAETLRGLV